MWKGVRWSLSILGVRITAQDMHIDTLWLLQQDYREDQALSLGLTLDWGQNATHTVGSVRLRCDLTHLKGDEGTGNQANRARSQWGLGDFNWLVHPTAMSQRKLTRQLRLWESPEGPPPAPSLTSPVSPVDQLRGHGGSALFRRMKLNRSIQESRRACQCICRYRFASSSYLFLFYCSPSRDVRLLNICVNVFSLSK